MTCEKRSNPAGARRAGERGAALVTMLLVATMLLGAGGLLVLTTAGSSGVAGDATTEMQAYYAAEAGMQSALAVLRRNVASAAGTKPSFRNAADNPTLSPWLTYTNVGGQQRIILTATPPTAYTVNVIDPDAKPAAEEPSRLLVQVRGFGPRGAVRQTEMMLHRSPYDLDPPAAITLIGAESGASMLTSDFDIGESSPKGYTGDDSAGTGVSKASFAFTVAADQLIAQTKFATDPKAADSTDDTPSRAHLIAQSSLPSWLSTVSGARNFLIEAADAAKNSKTPGKPTQDRYFTSSPSKDDFGTDANPLMTFVEGDCDFQGNGAGLLVVTGKLTLNGGSNFNGVVLLLGGGSLERKGGGGGGIYGALIMARFNSSTSTYLAKPSITTSGGGNSDIKYHSVHVTRAFQTFNPVVRDVREF